MSVVKMHGAGRIVSSHAGNKQQQRERLPRMKARWRGVDTMDRWPVRPARGCSNCLLDVMRGPGRSKRSLQLALHSRNILINVRNPVGPVSAPHRNVAVSDVWAVYGIGARSDGCPSLARSLVSGKCKLASLRVTRLLVDLKQDSAAQLGCKESAQSVLNQDVLFDPP